VPAKKLLALDIGRTTVRLAVVERRQTRYVIRDVQRSATSVAEGDMASRLVELLCRRLGAVRGIEAIGIGTAGQVSRAGEVSTATAHLYRCPFPLEKLLSDELSLPVVVRNDVQVMTLAEARYGAAREWPVVFGVAIGSGVGGGLVRDGYLDIGAGGIAGECGHVRAVDNGRRRPCWCGGKGCLDVQVSGPAIEQRYRALSGVAKQATDVLRARRTDPMAAQLTESVVAELATGLETIACCVDPHGIVLGGSVGVAMRSLLPPLRRQVARHAYRAVRDLQIRTAELGPDAQLYGAAVLCESVA
jgi:glucokinase